jgi:hypothetical protein
MTCHPTEQRLLRAAVPNASRAEPVSLDAASVEAVALRVVELLREDGFVAPPAGRLVTAAELAARLGVERSWVYEHQERLGVRRLGDGSRARLRFDLEEASAAAACFRGRKSDEPDHGPVEPSRRRRRSSRLGTGVELLPIRGREAA